MVLISHGTSSKGQVMQSRKRFSLRARLLVSFGVTMLLTLVLGVYSIASISSENASVRRLATKVVPTTSLAGQAAALMNKYRKDQLHYILSTPAQRAGSQGVSGDLAGDLTGMAQVLAQYHQQHLASSAREQQIVSDFSTAFYRYVRQSSAFRRLADAGRLQQAGQVVGAGAADNTYNVMKTASTDWLNYEARLAGTAAAGAHSTYTASLVVTLILVALALTAAFVIPFLLYRRLVGGLRKVGAAATAIAAGDLDQQVKLGGDDELTDLVAQFDSMIAYLQTMAEVAERISHQDLSSDVHPRTEHDRLGVAFQRMNLDLREKLGDHSCIDALSERLDSLKSNCLTDLRATLEAMNRGDLTVAVVPVTQPIEAQDGEQLGQLAEVFNEMLATTNVALNTCNELRETLRHKLGDHSSIDALTERMESLNNNCLAGLRTALQAMNEGDLTMTVKPLTKPIVAATGGDAGYLAEVFNGMLETTTAALHGYNDSRAKVADMIGEISQSSQALLAASNQMASTSEESGRAITEIAEAIVTVAQGAEQQVHTVQDARRITDQLADASRTSAETADQTAGAAAEARKLAHEGVQAADGATQAMEAVRRSSSQVSEAMRSLGQKSAQIDGIIETITGIAAQTNLLALNAAIEAARAGEHGRGFAVVAEEVRHLAEESQDAAATIGALIEQIQQETARAVEVVELGAGQTREGVETVEQTREVFLRIGQSVEDVTTRVEQIASSVRAVAAASDQMRGSMESVATVAEATSASTEQVSASTEQSSASTQQIAASAQQLASTADQLEHLVAQFVLA